MGGEELPGRGHSRIGLDQLIDDIRLDGIPRIFKIFPHLPNPVGQILGITEDPDRGKNRDEENNHGNRAEK